MEKQIKKTVKIALIFLAIGLLLGTLIAFAATPSNTFYISGGVYSGAPSYTIWKEGSNYFAKDNNGQIDYDDTNATELTEDVLTALSSGGSILFTSGTYDLNIVLNQSNIVIKGEGQGNTILRNDNTNPVIHITGTAARAIQQILIEDLTITNSSASTGNGITATRTTHTFTIQRVLIQYMAANGISLTECWGANIVDCKIATNEHNGIRIMQSHGMNIESSYIIDNGVTTYENIRVTNSAGVSIKGCIIENSIYGIILKGNCKGTEIMGCFLEVSNEGTSLISVQGNSTDDTFSVIIINCFFEGHAGTYPTRYINVEYSNQTHILHNYFPVDATMTEGIKITANADGTAIRDNVFRGLGTYITDNGLNTTTSGYGY